jgi:HlyD family secretion protein
MTIYWRRTIAGTAAALAVAVTLVYAFWPRPVPVDMATVERGDLTVHIDAEGETRVRDVYVVSAPIAGRMLRIERKAGDVVTAGKTLLARIQPSAPTFLDARSRRQAEAEVKAAEAAMLLARAERDRAAAELDYADAELERARALSSRGNISASNLDRAEMEVKTRRAALATAGAQLEVRRFELETARAALIEPAARLDEIGTCCVDLPAPIDGSVLRILTESEGVVQAGTPLVEIGDPRDLEIVVDLLSSDAVKVAPGAAVLIGGWGGGQDLKGTVRRVEPFGFTKTSALGIDEQRVNVIIDFDGDPEQRAKLGHGFRVDTRIEIWRGEGLLTLPVSALFREGDTWAVFAVRDARAVLTPVDIGQRNGRRAEVLNGLQAGDRVILHPSDRIDDGIAVEARP